PPRAIAKGEQGGPDADLKGPRWAERLRATAEAARRRSHMPKCSARTALQTARLRQGRFCAAARC
ncbi:MAG: hypothetical protein ACI95R_003050, partial [Halioglobus sp.]